MSLVSPRMKGPTMMGGSKHKRKIDFTLNNNNNENDDDSVSSHEDDYVSDSSGDDSSSSGEEDETVDAKRIRLAREYLRKMEEKEEDEEDEEEGEEEDKLSKRLEEDRLKRMGKWQEPVADRMEELLLSNGTRTTVQYLRGPHDLTVTCVALSSNQQYIYSGSKDHSIAMWDVSTQKLQKVIQPTWNKRQQKSNTNTTNDDEEDATTTRQGGQVLCMDCQDSYLAIGTRDAILSIYNSSTGKCMERFKGHSKAITCLTFLSSNIVMTGSDDRCIRQVSLEQMAHVETLYGHQAAVSSISSSATDEDKPMSVGRDRTARVWKLQEESHLIFRGGATMAPADTIATMNDHKHFLTGHEDGTLAMWNTAKKRPIYTTKTTTNDTYPITSLAIHTDIAITGSHDGQLRFWKVGNYHHHHQQQQ